LLLGEGFKDVRLLPTIYHKEVKLRERYYGIVFSKVQKTKCPDCMAGDQVIEFKTWAGGNWSLKHSLQDAAKQANVVVIVVKGDFDITVLTNMRKGALQKYPNLKEVYFFGEEGTPLMTKAK
jgi:hypothetical protein